MVWALQTTLADSGKLVADDGGTWVLAKVDVDAQQAIAQAFQVQSVPTVVAIIKGSRSRCFKVPCPNPSYGK